MANLFTSSIGKKLVMSISGCFLVLFLIFHMCMNITAVFSEDAYNWICEMLGANWYALAATAILAAGVVVHILYALVLTIQNLKARGKQRYAVTRKEAGVSWSSKNMLVLGLVIAGGLLLHLWNFWYNMQLQEILNNHVNQYGLTPVDGAGLIRYWFSQPFFAVFYLVWFTAIWFHLTHGLWSMFQTTGLANKTWYPRLKLISNIGATVIFLGFGFVVVYTFITTNFCGVAV